MKHVSLLIKPASGLCNMRCAYCFYADEAEHRTEKNAGMMTLETAESLIHNAFSSVEKRGTISFSFQGGEPTLAGLDFFRKFVRMAEERNPGDVAVQWGIQTNGLQLNEEWAAFLASHRFLTGISMDGDAASHDAFRRDAHGEGTYQRVKRNLEMLLRSNVETNILCVVNSRTAKAPKRTYRSLKALNTGFLQFIPCLDPLDKSRGSMKWSLTPEDYGQFLSGTFDEWFLDWQNGQYTSIRFFDDLVHLALGMPPSTCASCGQCGGYFVVEADGSVYPCDFYALDEWRLGSVQESFRNLMHSEKMRSFLQRSARKPASCGTCPYFALCRGGCPRDWIEGDRGPENYYCKAFAKMFQYIGPKLMYIVQQERSARYRMR
ncbi:MAG: anaerobic sulfatase maturase [Clostridia bacterium]|nr:anaerobic sulfatase maturase [Clostridia bacterium]